MRERENNTFRRKKERKRNQNHEGENLVLYLNQVKATIRWIRLLKGWTKDITQLSKHISRKVIILSRVESRVFSI